MKCGSWGVDLVMDPVYLFCERAKPAVSTQDTSGTDLIMKEKKGDLRYSQKALRLTWAIKQETYGMHTFMFLRELLTRGSKRAHETWRTNEN